MLCTALIYVDYCRGHTYRPAHQLGDECENAGTDPFSWFQRQLLVLSGKISLTCNLLMKVSPLSEIHDFILFIDCIVPYCFPYLRSFRTPCYATMPASSQSISTGKTRKPTCQPSTWLADYTDFSRYLPSVCYCFPTPAFTLSHLSSTHASLPWLQPYTPSPSRPSPPRTPASPSTILACPAAPQKPASQSRSQKT